MRESHDVLQQRRQSLTALRSTIKATNSRDRAKADFWTFRKRIQSDLEACYRNTVQYVLPALPGCSEDDFNHIQALAEIQSDQGLYTRAGYLYHELFEAWEKTIAKRDKS
jgi:molecular chaperone GrpE (heat shock protein)